MKSGPAHECFFLMAWEAWKTSSFERKLLAIAGSALWCVLLLAAAWTMELNEPYLPAAIAGGLIFYLRSAPKIAEQVAWLALSLGFAWIVHFPQTERSWKLAGFSVAALFGLGAFLILGWRWLWSEPSARRKAYAMLAPAIGLVFFVFSVRRALSLANLLHPKTYDLYLYVFDGSFGFQPSFLMGQAMAVSVLLRLAARLTYASLPFVMALVYALRLPKGSERPSWDMIILFLLTGLGGLALYNIVPAAGPAYVFGASFPWQALPYRSLPRLFLEPVPVARNIPRNAIPSLHLAWAVLLYWNTKGLGLTLRIFLAAYVALTVVSTLGTGEHYFVDLVAGIPFALFVQAVVSPGHRVSFSRRAVVAAASMAMTLAWLLLARFGVKAMLVSPILPWSLATAICLAAFVLKAWFASAVDSSSSNGPERPAALGQEAMQA
jgi:PAP2 superfamily